MPKLWPAVVLCALSACNYEFEGDDPGECADGADNDRDRMYDCQDPDCASSPVCLGLDEDTDVEPVDTDPGETDDTDVEETDTDTDVEPAWDCPDRDLYPEAYDTRPAGPHACEVGVVTAWLQDHASGTTSTNAACLDTTSEDWAPVFERPSWNEDQFYYKFYRLEGTLTAAPGQNCANGYPLGCVTNDDVTYVWDDGEDAWVATLDEDVTAVDPIAAPGCSLTLQQYDIIEDKGPLGVLRQEVHISTTAACPPTIAENNGCVFTHTYDLDFAAAE